MRSFERPANLLAERRNAFFQFKTLRQGKPQILDPVPSLPHVVIVGTLSPIPAAESASIAMSDEVVRAVEHGTTRPCPHPPRQCGSVGYVPAVVPLRYRICRYG